MSFTLVSRSSVAIALLAALTACSAIGVKPATDRSAVPVAAGDAPPVRVKGYLAADAIPDSLALSPAPPADGSPARALDQTISEQALALRGSPRWQQAHIDAELGFPAAAEQFSCALGVQVDTQRTPALYRLLERTRSDAGASVRDAKNRYQRARPFMLNQQPTCSPEDEPGLRGNGSYPSGHTAIGWTWALVLAEAAPEQASAILQRGRAYGQSRLVCNVHWYSDVRQGQFMAAATVARLHDEAAFRGDLQAARGEILQARRDGHAPQRDCAAEAAALETTLPDAG